MMWIAYWLAGGTPFLLGASLSLLSGCAPLRWRSGRRLARLGAALGLALALLSAVPAPWPVYAAWLAASLVWLIVLTRHSPQPGRDVSPGTSGQLPGAVTATDRPREAVANSARPQRRHARAALAARSALAATALFAAAGELRWQIMPWQPIDARCAALARPGSPLSPDQGPICVIGDSLSAGIGRPDEAPWPHHLGALSGRIVVNFAAPGATARSALDQARRVPDRANLVLIEIGGNDLLGGRPTAEFEADLRTLLEELRRPGRCLIMFELPLPPLANGYGLAQRRLACEAHTGLLPRRHLAGVLRAPGTTADGLHLSARGHEQLAEVVWRELR